MPDMQRFLQGPFAPLAEEVTAFDLPVTGRLPGELSGRYLRNGPNPMGLDDPGYHWFLGPGMVHGVRLRDGRAEWYRNRWVRSKDVAEKLGEPWPAGPVHEGFDFAANTHVIGHAGRTLATVEAGPLPYQLSDELDTIGPYDFGGTLPGGFAAHTKLDRRTGELHAIAYFWAWDHVQHLVIDATGQVTRTTDIPVADGPMMHDFALTEKYVVLYDLPVTFSQYQSEFDVSTLWAAHGPVTLDRWIIDTAAGKVTQQRIDDRPQEFPRVDERAVSRPHRYGYSAVIREVSQATVQISGDFADPAFANAVLKHDLARGTVEAHEFGPEATSGEAVFVPASSDAAEDDGYVIAFVHNPERGAADLVILAAQDFTGEPVARVHLPARIPLGFHGNWIADQ
jgi:carotenoid cleavage dioxygenase